MSGGGSSGSTTTVQKSEPWEGQKQFLLSGFRRAGNVFHENNLPSYYPGDPVADIGGRTQRGLDLLAMRGEAGSPVVRDAGGQLSDTLQGQFFGAAPGFSTLRDLARGETNPALSGLRAAAGSDLLTATPGGGTFRQVMDSGDNRAIGLLEGTARGQFLDANPHLDAMIRDSAEDVVGATAGLFARGGRYGSGAHQGVTMDAVGDMASRLRGENFARERQNQLAAAGQIGQFANQDVAQRLAAAGQLGQNFLAARGLQQQALGQMGGLAAQDEAQRFAAAGQLGSQFQQERDQQLRAAALAPAIANQDLVGARALIESGQIMDAQTQAEIDAAMARHDFNQNRDATQLFNYLNAVRGNYGQTQTSTQPYFRNTGANALGGAMSGALIGSAFGAPGALIGGGLGGLMGLF